MKNSKSKNQKTNKKGNLKMETQARRSGRMKKCGCKTEIYSRVCGYFRPVANWNKGKREEFKDRKTYLLCKVV